MLNLVAFETEEELCELTWLTEQELWERGFNIDDWEIGFQFEVKLHKTPTKKDIENPLIHEGRTKKQEAIYIPTILPAYDIMHVGIRDF